MSRDKENIKRFENGKVPEYKTKGASCADCYARIESNVVIDPMKNAIIPLGFALELPEGYEAEIRPRSGFARKMIFSVQGTIDSDYRGECMVNIVNLSDKAFTIEPNERICQMKITPSFQYRFNEVIELSETERGSGGFGSTGTK